MKSPSAYPDALEGEIQLIETHVSLVFLRRAEVLKVKKPLDLGFLDFRTLESRRIACEAEVRLNERLAPDIYLGVAPVRQRADGMHHLGSDGEIVDYGVRMRRLSDEHRADILLERDEIDGAIIDEIAATLARFHENAEHNPRIESFGAPEIIEHSVRENFEQTRGVVDRYLESTKAEELEAWQLGTLRDRAESFRKRARSGRVREGHGDLRLEHLYFREDGSLKIIDCIEFNERFRYADVGADLAFLAMDLVFHDRPDLSERLLSSYARESGDYELYELIDFYESYRAYVRAKVSSMLADDEGADAGTRRRAADLAKRYFRLAFAMKEPLLLPPMIIAVGGIIASGKSTVSRKLGELLSVPIIDADRTRKQLLGVTPFEPVHEPIWQGAYSPDRTEQVYSEVLRRARIVIGSGRTVLLDASFRSAKMRQQAHSLAEDLGVPFLFIECQAPREVCRERLVRREQEGGVSDGRLAIFDDFCARWEQVEELPPREHLVLDTSRALDENLKAIEAHVPLWPRHRH